MCNCAIYYLRAGTSKSQFTLAFILYEGRRFLDTLLILSFYNESTEIKQRNVQSNCTKRQAGIKFRIVFYSLFTCLLQKLLQGFI